MPAEESAETTLNVSKVSLAFGVGGIATLFLVGAAWGTQNERINRLERDMHERAPTSEMEQGFRSIETRLVRIEQGLDRVLMIVPPSAQRTP